jgi:hypothetical protein
MMRMVMKKTYEKPKITVLGTIEEITQAFGSSSAADVIYFGGQPLPTLMPTHGSQDGIVVPKPWQR